MFRIVILAGGSGTRLWPLSRAGFPKQFLTLTGNTSLLQQACTRLKNGLHPIVVTNEEHRFLASEQLREINCNNAKILLEPVGKNTAPAMTFAAFEADEEQILVVMPADQTIQDAEGFESVIDHAVDMASEGAVVVLGVKPTHPHTGYGYIKSTPNDLSCVESFVEKPDLKTAEKYLKQGGYSWNAGIFVVKAGVWLKALSTFRPDILSATKAAHSDSTCDGNFIRPNKRLFEKIPPESIDYAVIEKCPGSEIPVKVIELDVGWNDLGSWDSVADISEKNGDGNSLTGDTFVSGTKNSYVNATSRLVSVIGMDGVVVVETPDAVLVTNKQNSQAVKQVVEYLKNSNREESVLHRKVARPWGWYDSLDECSRFKVKRIQVNPGASLSLQKHHHRAEHWIVVKGTAEVTRGDEVLLLTENQSTYIPLGETHRLKNPGKTPLEIIEVQSGSYLGEDDIVRLEDNYGR